MITDREQQRDRERRILRIYLEFVLLLFVVAGVFGSAWLDDDLNNVKLSLGAFVGIPLAGLYYTLLLLGSDWNRKHRITFTCVVLGMLAAFTPGWVSLVNAMEAEPESSYVDTVESGSVHTLTKSRGSFGLLYVRRW